MSQITIAVMRPGAEGWSIERHENTLESFQKIIGGYIEAVQLTSDIWLYCHEEGKLIDLPPVASIILKGDIVDTICGPFFLTGAPDADGYETSITEAGLNSVQGMLRKIQPCGLIK